MPKYRYRCLECKESFEMYQKMADAPVGECYLTVSGKIGSPDAVICKGEVVRVPVMTGFSLKGKGWYKDGY